MIERLFCPVRGYSSLCVLRVRFRGVVSMCLGYSWCEMGWVGLGAVIHELVMDVVK